jgi:uncharacterized protein (TIGR03118 family)
MKKLARRKKLFSSQNLSLFLVFAAVLSVGCHKSIPDKDLRDFQQVNLVANKSWYNPVLVDPTLQNAWGLAWSPTGIAWVNSNGGQVSELYTAEGAIVRPPVHIPSPTDTIGGVPSGIVFSGNMGFTLANHQGSSFLFVGEDGVLSGWNGAAGNNALRIKDRSATSIYKGMALSVSGGKHFIYAANFKTGKIDVWDTTFAPVSMPFHDPALPAGYAPFNIQAVSTWLFVTYAKVGPGGGDETDGAGLGFVNVFNTDGSFVKRFASRGSLNAPWGVAMAPAGFLESNDMGDGKGKGSNSESGKDNSGHGDDDANTPVILVGNFGDGRINVFAEDGAFLGQLQSHNRTIVIDGLWALSFPPVTATTIDPMRLYFTAGPANEMDGLFGYLIKQ